MVSGRRLRAVAGLAATAIAAAVPVSSGSSATNATTLVIWADADRVPAVTQVATAWAASRGVTVQIVQKELGEIRAQVTTAAVDAAPDVILGAHDWVGELSASGTVLPLSPPAATKKQFPASALNAFSYGLAVKKLYGAPVAIENVALFTNTALAKVPTLFADLEKQALAAKRKTRASVGIAVQQGPGGDPYHTYPFFSGLGGYVFGTNSVGNLDPSNIGVANAKFLTNARMIDRWNKEALIRSQVTGDLARDLFTRGRTAFYVTGPWYLPEIRTSGVRYTISGFPQIVPGIKSVPLLAVQGFMVTRFSSAHGVESLAKDLVANSMMRPASQLSLGLANGRFPANSVAGSQVRDRDLKGFGKASVGGVPTPNVPQAASVWPDLGAAWVRSTKGSGAVLARRSFIGAQKRIAEKIG